MDRKLTTYLSIAFVISILMCGFAWWMHRLPNVLDFVPETQQWWRDFLLNAGAGIITSVLIIFFYDRILMKKEEKTRALRQNIALDSMQKILDDHFRHVLYGMYRTAAIEEKKFDSLEDFFSEDYYCQRRINLDRNAG